MLTIFNTSCLIVVCLSCLETLAAWQQRLVEFFSELNYEFFCFLKGSSLLIFIIFLIVDI